LCRDGRSFARVTFATGARRVLPLPVELDEGQAAERAESIASMVLELRRAGVDTETIGRLATRAAAAVDGAELEAIDKVAERLIKGELRSVRAPLVLATFADVANAWTSGELARLHPDHVRTKRSADDDRERLCKYVLPEIGPVPIAKVTLDHALGVMSALPAELTPATRRHVAQVMNRVLKLAVFPLRLRESSPLPVGWMPKIQAKAQRKQAMPYPAELDRLLGCSSEPKAVRILLGFVAREGMRPDEARSLSWSDVDLERGIVRLDRNKTDDPRSWAIRADVARALRLWHVEQGSPAEGLVFPAAVDAVGYRAALARVGVSRRELFEHGKTTTPTGLHSLRGLFVTEALARGMSERWVGDRTGHKSSTMISTYQRRARTFQEASVEPHGSLDVLLGWPADERDLTGAERDLGSSATAAPSAAMAATSQDRSRRSPVRDAKRARGTIQNPLPERECRFESDLRYHQETTGETAALGSAELERGGGRDPHASAMAQGEQAPSQVSIVSTFFRWL